MSSLEATLGHVSSLHGDLNGLLERLNNMRTKLKGHEPPRVLPADVERQLKKLSVSQMKIISNEVIIFYSAVTVCRELVC